MANYFLDNRYLENFTLEEVWTTRLLSKMKRQMAQTPPPPPAANIQNTKSPSEWASVCVDHHDSDRLSGFVSALPDFTTRTQNVSLKTELVGTEIMTGKFLNGWGGGSVVKIMEHHILWHSTKENGGKLQNKQINWN